MLGSSLCLFLCSPPPCFARHELRKRLVFATSMISSPRPLEHEEAETGYVLHCDRRRHRQFLPGDGDFDYAGPWCWSSGSYAMTPATTCPATLAFSYSRTRMSPSAMSQLIGCMSPCSTFFSCIATQPTKLIIATTIRQNFFFIPAFSFHNCSFR